MESHPFVVRFLQIALPLVHGAGIVAGVHVVMNGRTVQGTVAWVIGLLSFPYLAVPLYLVFGNHRFEGYVKARRAGETELHGVAERLAATAACQHLLCSAPGTLGRVVSRVTRMPVTCHNRAQLLVDGHATFTAIFDAIERARDYVLVQFYIIRDDDLGRDLQRRLVARARAGVRVYLLYDEIGCHQLSETYLDGLRAGGVAVTGFASIHSKARPLQLNFRNHRKVVVVDGRTAFVGGHNVGDEYLGRSPQFGRWRDTHVRVEGPVVQAVQLAFCEDWYSATGELPGLDWDPRPAVGGDLDVLAVPSGPADEFETCTLLFVQAINSARDRLWIVSPYFVPDTQVMTALKLAAMRGVDVRVLLPERADHLLVYLSSYSYLPEAEQAGVKVYRYGAGFLHQKVMLVDDRIATVGTANFDNRSFRINFEITLLFTSPAFAREVEQMLEADFARSRPVRASEFHGRPFPYRLAVRVARLLAPVQ